MLHGSPTFCVLPFIQFSNELDGMTRPCCETVGGFGDASHGILESWNGEGWRGLRKALASGERHPACQRCWDQEDRGILSARAQNNGWHGHLLDPASSHFHRGTGAMHIPPRSLVLRFSSLCNLACRMCSPGVSSSVAHLWDEELTAITGRTKCGVMRNFPDRAALREELRRIGPSLRQVSFSGGEPLADPAVEETLVALHPWAHRIRAHLSTNLSRLRFGGADVLLALLPFGQRLICISIDGPPALHAYIRPGLDLKTFLRNLVFLHRSRIALLHVNVAVQALNALKLPEAIDFALRAVQPGTILASIASSDPEDYIDPRALPAPLKARLHYEYERFRGELTPATYPAISSYVLEQAMSIVDSLERFVFSADLCTPERWARLSAYYRKLDLLHGTDIDTICPEIAAHLLPSRGASGIPGLRAEEGTDGARGP